MLRFALILLMSLAVSSHAVAGRVFKDSGKTVVMGGDKKSAEDYDKFNITDFGFEIPEKAKPNDDTLAWYFRLYLLEVQNRKSYSVKPTSNVRKLEFNTVTSEFVRDQMQNTALISYLIYQNGQVHIDEVSPTDRFGDLIDDKTKINSFSVGKSVLSYLLSHSICTGYISGLDEKIDWEVLDNTLYKNQSILNLINMSSGDQNYINRHKTSFAPGKWVNSRSVADVMTNELKGSTPAEKRYNYNELNANIILNYIIYKSGGNFQELLTRFFAEKIGVEYEVGFQKTVNYTPEREGLGRNNMYATRHDYLRIAISMLEDWKNQTCEGKLLKEMYDNRRKKSGFGGLAETMGFSGYGGFFHTDLAGFKDKNLIVMQGFGGQYIWIDFDEERIIVSNAIHENYDWKGLFVQPLSGNLPKQSIPTEEISIANVAQEKNLKPDDKAQSKKFISGLGSRAKDVVIFEDSLTFLPKTARLKGKSNDATLEYYYLMQDWRRTAKPRQYFTIKPSGTYKEFENSNQFHEKIETQMKSGSLLSYIYYANGKIIYDYLPPEGRFIMRLGENSYFPSHSMGKSITSYMIGHAICKGYIGSVDEKIENWPMMENTLYYGQPLINLLNMTSGDGEIIKNSSTNFIKTGRNYKHQTLSVSAKTEGELLNTSSIEGTPFSYSNLTSDVLINFLAHRIGKDFNGFLNEFYQSKIKVKHPIYMSLFSLEDSLEKSITNLTKKGAWQYGIYATRQDYLRIATSMLDDWNNNSCEGKYLKTLHERAVKTGSKQNWKKWPNAPHKRFTSVASEYAGQFWAGILGMNDQNIFVMDGKGAQQIIINFDEARIIVINSAQAGWYNTKSIAYDLIKSGKMKSGNWN